MSVKSIRILLDEAFDTFKEASRERIQGHLSEMWAKIDTQEEQIWEQYERLTSGWKWKNDNKTALAREREIARCLDSMDEIASRRLEILRMADPGADESVQSKMTLVLVNSRDQIQAVTTAIEFQKAVILDGAAVNGKPVEDDGENNILTDDLNFGDAIPIEEV